MLCSLVPVSRTSLHKCPSEGAYIVEPSIIPRNITQGLCCEVRDKGTWLYCQAGPNNELHLVFECTAMSNLRNEPWMQSVLNEAKDKERIATSDNRKLQSFLGGDLASAKTLWNRGTFLSILRQNHLKLKEASP